MNALIFLVPEDIVDVRPRLVSLTIHSFMNTADSNPVQIMTFVGSLMSLASQ